MAWYKFLKYRNFLKDIDFVNDIARIAEAKNHHHRHLLHSYNQVKVITIAHNEGQTTCKDYKFERSIDSLTHLR